MPGSAPERGHGKPGARSREGPAVEIVLDFELRGNLHAACLKPVPWWVFDGGRFENLAVISNILVKNWRMVDLAWKRLRSRHEEAAILGFSA